MRLLLVAATLVALPLANLVPISNEVAVEFMAPQSLQAEDEQTGVSYGKEEDFALVKTLQAGADEHDNDQENLDEADRSADEQDPYPLIVIGNSEEEEKDEEEEIEPVKVAWEQCPLMMEYLEDCNC